MQKSESAIPMPKEDDNMLDNFGHHEEKEYILKEQDI